MKKIILFLMGLTLLGCLLMAGVAGLIYYQTTSPGPLNESKLVLIERGRGIASIAQTLENDGVISSAFFFKILAGYQKSKGSLKAGEYEFPAGVSLQEVAAQMREGRVYDRKITFPEGLTSYQIVEMLKANDALTGEIAEIPQEGSLMPETYHFIKGDSRESIIKQMEVAMSKTIDELWPARREGLPISTIEEMLTLASIVEKETGVASERAKVAGVFINRLRRGMPMQSDPTVIYALTEGRIQNEGQGPLGRRLLTKDLSIASPYNTYANPGLPPAPIANPGRASIEAVLHPEIHDFVYFVADGTGGHVFGRTLDEHNRNVAKWRKFRRSQQQ
jgi:UPF0755 protein